MKDKVLWDVYNEEQLAHLENICADYRNFLDNGKTEQSKRR